MKGSHKGSAFERDICKQLSLWWSKGENDDIFWRTPGSGARATVRNKKNKESMGFSDIQATDPIGQPLIDLCSIELKRGYSKTTFADVIDKLDKSKEQLFESFVKQATSDGNLSGCFSWTLITKRDRRKPLIFTTLYLYEHLKSVGCDFSETTHTFLYFKSKEGYNYKIFGAPLEDFLKIVKPSDIKKIIAKCGI